ncbi:MAG TPA: ATP-binding cassette domain-containing protein, partial [Limnobacter sp.]|nr:ATP-binding cassette domain-containing protein [Limnobacter sp.]
SAPKPCPQGSCKQDQGGHLLQEISFDLQKGDRLGVVGATGSGKTSLLRLLARQIPFDKGQYTINGLSADHYHPSELASNIGVALQPPVLLKGTLLENLQFRRPHVSTQHCWESLEAMGLADWVKEHPDGLYMAIDSQGSNLSSGQKQAISLCRALAGRPTLLLLDEPTVCLDQTLEQRLMQAISDLPAHVIVVFTTHKLSMLSAANALMLLHRSRIYSQGDKPTVLHAAKALQSKLSEKSQ